MSCVPLACWLVIGVFSVIAWNQSTNAADVLTLVEAGEQVELELKHAETYYWFGMAEQGNMSAFHKGLRHLKRASDSVDKGGFPTEQRGQFVARIEGLRTDLVEQIEIAHDTLYGVFPLSRFLARSIFADSVSLKTFEVIDDPNVMAATFAAKNLALVTIEQWRQRHQLDVVFTSMPRNPQLENEALYVFNSHPKFFVHNLREVTDALSPSQLVEFQLGNVTPEIQAAMLEAFQLRDLLVVTVQRVDVIDDDYFYILAGAIYHERDVKPTHNFAVMGFSRDRNAQLWPILATNLVLLGLTYLAFWLQAKARRKAGTRTTPTTFIVLPLLVFTVGRCSPWFFAPILGGIAPIPETLAIVSFWVPAVAGTILTVVPMMLAWLVANRLKKRWPTFRIEGRALSVFLGIGAGAVGYLAALLFLYVPHEAWFILFPALFGVGGIALLMARAVEQVDRSPIGVVVIPALLSLLLGIALFQALAAWTLVGAVTIVVAAAIPVVADLRRRPAIGLLARRARESASPDRSDPAAHVEVDGAALGELAENPQFQKLAIFETCRTRFEPLLAGKTVHLALWGSGGCGLTSTSQTLGNEIVSELVQRGREAVAMTGECPQAVGEPIPYAPFQKALAQHFEVELLATPDASDNEMDAALGEVFQSVVPFAGILFPASAGMSTATSTEEIVASISWMLRRLAKKSTIVLLIDDAHWADDASKSLLQRLLAEFPAGGNVPIAIIATSHQEAACVELGFSEQDQVQLDYPTHAEQLRILVEGVGLSQATAEQVVSRMGASTVDKGGLFWLLQIVANLARAGAFEATAEGYTLRDGKWPTGMFIPNALRDDLCERLRKSPQYRLIIECAACASFGREFRASVVAQAIGKSRLELLAELDTIDRETSILYDVRSRDDVFAFQSTFMLDVVRQELRIAEHGPAADDAPQIIREHHARLGEVCAQRYEVEGQYLYQVANHFYAAGTAHAERGMRYCLEAARAAARVFDFDAAERFVERAHECAHVIGQGASVDEDRLRIACEKTHLTGEASDHARVAEAGAAYLREHRDCSSQLLLRIAQAHYDAGKSTGNQVWFEQSLAIGRRMIEHAQSVHDEALGHHFVGISLAPADRLNREKSLRRALELISGEVDADEKASPEDLELLGRILGSLAEELSYGGEAAAREAKELFQRRLRIYATNRIGDAPGLAKTHGGLGRLAFFGAPRDLTTAREHFQKDLEISEAIGDIQGQTQMHSLLGACALEEGDFDSASAHYQRSWELARHTVNRFFAGAGLLKCHASQRRWADFGELAKQLIEFAEAEGMPATCAEAIRDAIAACPVEHHQDDTRALLRYVNATSQ